MKLHLWIFLAAPFLVTAQVPASLATPTLGYVYDADAQSLRALEGVPGAAVLGDALHLETLFDAIAVAPGRRYGLGTRAGDATLALIRLDGRTGAAAAGEMPAGRAFFSPGGGTVALLNNGSIEVWTGMPDNPMKLRSVAAGVGEIRKVAVSDDGGALVALADDVLWSLGENGEALGTGYRDLQFLRTSQDLVALDGSGLKVFRKASKDSLEDYLTGSGPDAVAFALSRDEATAAVLSRERVALLRKGTETPITLDLDEIEAGGLWRTEGNAVFQLQNGSGGEIWLLDGDGEEPRLLPVTATSKEGAVQ